MPPTRIIWTLGRMGLQGKAGALTACRGEARVRERGGRRRLGQQKCPHPFHLCPPSPTSATSIAIAQTVCPHHSRLYLCSASGWAAQRRQQRAGDVSCTGQLAFAFPNHLSLVALVVGFWFTHKPRASFPSGKDKHCPPWLGWGHCTVVCKDRQIGYSRSTACYRCLWSSVMTPL